MRLEQRDIAVLSAELDDPVAYATQDVKRPQNLEPVAKLDACPPPLLHGHQGIGADASFCGQICLGETPGLAHGAHAVGQRAQHIFCLKRKAVRMR